LLEVFPCRILNLPRAQLTISNALFPSGLPPEIAARYDGILDGLAPEVLAKINPQPDIDTLIEWCCEDIDAWSDNILNGDDHGDQRFAVERVICNLRFIALLSGLKGQVTAV
jgi:hypothetical protein